MTRNAIVDALGVLKAGRIVDLTHLVHPGIQRFGPFPAMRTEPRYTVAESGFHVEQVSFVTQYGTHVDAPEHFVEGRRTLERIELEERGVTAVGHETLDTDGSADVRARGARLREVRARVRSLSGRGHGELPSTGGVIFVGLPKFDKFPGFPVRAWAVVPNED